MSHEFASAADKPRVGLAVVFAALGEAEEASIKLMWQAATAAPRHWQPAFIQFGIDPLPYQPQDLDILVYLGESSRFERVAGELSKCVPIVFVKSTVEELMTWPLDSARRYRMSTGVDGIGRALAAAAPAAPSVNWTKLPWPAELAHHTHMDAAEAAYVEKSLGAFRKMIEARGQQWLETLPEGDQPFSIFLTMHDPAAAELAEAALKTWPQCTVITADGMTSMRQPSGEAWPKRQIRVRHWSPQVRSRSNELFSEAVKNQPLPDFDSPGMTYGALTFLDHAFGNGVTPEGLDSAGLQPGPTGEMRFGENGKCMPERLIIFHGEEMTIMEVPA